MWRHHVTASPQKGKKKWATHQLLYIVSSLSFMETMTPFSDRYLMEPGAFHCCQDWPKSTFVLVPQTCNSLTSPAETWKSNFGSSPEPLQRYILTRPYLLVVWFTTLIPILKYINNYWNFACHNMSCIFGSKWNVSTFYLDFYGIWKRHFVFSKNKILKTLLISLLISTQIPLAPSSGQHLIFFIVLKIICFTSTLQHYNCSTKLSSCIWICRSLLEPCSSAATILSVIEGWVLNFFI